jgi:His/Glu/Gln/Arg/opine family amino acid ABC transporter permease subunit
VLGGTIAIQVGYALAGGDLSAACREDLVIPTTGEPIRGALGVCHIVQGFNSGWQTAALTVGLILGAAAAMTGWGTFRRMRTKRMREQSIAGAVLGLQAVLLAGFFFWVRGGEVTKFSRLFLNIEVLSGSFDGFVRGARNTLVLAFSGEVGGIAIGLVLALFALSTRRVIRAPARAYINFFRGTPLIWQLSFFYLGIVIGLNVQLSAVSAAILVFSLNTGAYAAEVFRAGIQSIERGQIEAARSLGMSYLQAMRYAVMPQAVRRVIPPLMNEFVILIKDTALVIVIGLSAAELDIFNFARQGYAESFNATYLVAAAAGYLVVTLPLIRLVNVLEKRLHSGLVGVVGQT